MAINCYTGLMGSGKTYEVVENVIIPNYMKGRRIVTNINGLNEDKIKEYILKKHKNFNEENFGSIVLCSDEEAMKEDFFPQDDPSIDSFVKRGDFVVIDEAWKQWGSSIKLLPQHLLFFTKHRHFTNEKGISCDLAIIVQDISILNRTLKSLVEMIFRTKKLKSVGLSSSYTLQIYEGHRLTKQYLINTITRKYNKEIFPLYKSYANGDGKELQIDKRTSILSKKLLFIVIFLIAVGFWCASFIYSYFSSGSLAPSSNNENETISIKSENTNQINSNAEKQAIKNNSSVDFRLVGVLDTPSRRLIIIENKNDGSIKMVAPSLCKGVGISLTCNFDNQEINYYSGIIKQNNNSFFGGTQNEKNNLSSNN